MIPINTFWTCRICRQWAKYLVLVSSFINNNPLNPYRLQYVFRSVTQVCKMRIKALLLWKSSYHRVTHHWLYLKTNSLTSLLPALDLSNTSWQPVVSLFIPCHNVWMPLARRGSFQSWPSWGDASLHSPGCAVCLGLSCTAVDLWSRSALQCLQRKYLLSSTEKAFSKDTPNIPVCKAGEHFYTKFTKIIRW